MKVAFDGIGEKMVTFQVTGEVEEGDLVKISGGSTVGPCAAAGDVPVGVAQRVHDGLAAVQVGGCMKAPCATGTTVGFKLLASDKDGALAASESGRYGFVLEVDSSAGNCWVLF